MLKATRIFPSSHSLTLEGERLLEPILKTENLWKVYRQGKVEVPALRGVSIDIFPGEFVSIMGPSGCGKSTMLHVIGGLAQATSGRVLLDGNDLTTMSDSARTLLRRHKVGFKPSELSGGEQQRVALARAIVSEPKIVLADEPTGNLDTKSSEAVLGLLRELNQDLGQTIVMITHNPEAAAYGHRVLHMRDGEVVDGSSVH
jgi:putative ABC transport system ATP-binding protein